LGGKSLKTGVPKIGTVEADFETPPMDTLRDNRSAAARILPAGVTVDQLVEPMKSRLLGLLPITILRAYLRPQRRLRGN
jgi:hypothetical protein